MRDIGFRRLLIEDLPMLHRWLSSEHVRRWWSDEPHSFEEVTAKYRPVIDGTQPTDPFLILLSERPIGYIQRYLIADHPTYAEVVEVEADAAGVDLFIGEADLVGKGIGPLVIDEFLRTRVFTAASVGRVVIGPSELNHAAIRAYEKAGFIYLKTVHIPGELHPEYLMVRVREQVVD